MNDRFKFRVWDKGNEQYLNLSEVDYLTLNTENGGLIIGFLDELTTELTYMPEKDMVVEQCTGLKDKNGNLIYEGDIVYDSVYENNFVVSWDNDRTGYILSADNTNHIDYLSKILIERHNLKITGNIHEQAEQKE